MYDPTDGRFALTLTSRTPKWRDTGPDGEELWVMVDELRK